MRESFSYFIRPNENQLKKVWEDCVFVFDTNVLLDLFR